MFALEAESLSKPIWYSLPGIDPLDQLPFFGPGAVLPVETASLAYGGLWNLFCSLCPSCCGISRLKS